MKRFRIILMMLFSFSLCWLNGQETNKEIDSMIASANQYLFKSPEKSIEIGNAILQRKSVSDAYQISSYILISNGYSALGNYQKAIAFALKANERAGQTKDVASQIRTLGLIGNLYIRIEMRDEAWHYLDKADKLSQTVSLPDSKKYLIGNINLLKGFLYKRSLDCAYAIKHFNKAIAEFRKDQNNGFAKANLGQAYNQKALCYLNINKDSAQVSFEKGLADARKNGAKSLECNALIGLSEIQNSKNDFKASNQILLSALPLSEEVNQLEMQSRIYRLLAENFIALQEFDEHLKYQNLFNALQSRLSEEQSKTINELIQKRNEFKQKSFESSQKNLKITNWILALSLVAITILTVYFLILKSKKIKNKERITAQH